MEQDLSDLMARAQRLTGDGRRVLGVVGAPGSGKSTLASEVVARLGAAACNVPMDGFHLATSELERLGRADRKGAPDTFDVGGYAALLRRLREEPAAEVYAPEYRREIEEGVGAAIRVGPEVTLVVTEGNYLLHDSDGWEVVAALLDEVWFVEMDEERRLEQLTARHVRFGKSPEAAREWARGSDQRNAELVAATRHRADVVVRLSVGGIQIGAPPR